jgi:hypothetical protein
MCRDGQADGRKDCGRERGVTKLIVAFRNFLNAPKKGNSLINQIVEKQDLELQIVAVTD